MIEKSVKAPLTYNPGKGRPKEHLAYLNKGEMKALRLLNGNNMERGPGGLPSFPPADARGSSSKASSSTSKTTTKSSTTSRAPSSATASVSRSSLNVAKSSPAKQGSSVSQRASPASSVRAPAASAAAAKSSASKKGSSASQGPTSNSLNAPVRTVPSKGSPVTRQAAPASTTSKIGSAASAQRIGPAYKTPSYGGGARDSGQAASRVPEATITMPNITPPTGPMPQGIKNFVNRASNILDPNDPTLGRRSIQATEPPPTIGEALSNISIGGITKGIYDLGVGGIKGAIDLAYDPYGSLKRGIGAIGDYARGEIGNIVSGSEAAMLGPGYGSEEAIGRGFVSSLNMPVAAGVAGQFVPGPPNSVGMFVGPNASQILKDAYQKGRQLSLKGASSEDLFHETAKLTGPGVSGLQNIPNSPYWGYEVSAPMSLREGLFKPSGPIKSAENYVFGTRVEGMPTLGRISDTGALENMYGGDIAKTRVTQLYSPYERGFYPRDGRRISGSYDPNSDVIEMNEAATRGILSGYAKNYTPDEFRKTLIHEGQHKVAKLDPVFVPQGTGGDALIRFYQRSGVTPPSIEDIKGPSRDVYLGNKGEILARLSEQRADLPADQMKDYTTRITAQNREWDRVRAAQKAYQDALKDINIRRYSLYKGVLP